MLLGTSVRLNSDDWYLSVPASNQPDPDTKLFVLYAVDGSWDVDEDDIDYCMGFLLDHEELEFADDDEIEDVEEALDQLYHKNNTSIGEQ